ncbi:nitrogenase molybdenum-iron protein subunit beta [Geomonas subterranea]|uniref:Nitrogenase molybdenum-iron protein beta chain n=1 Tax=Geomonas subterranea TaxID=2847989 RepID=A0ABX8LP76_9BACT|nr:MULTISPECIES: nitrogenase molybdenum-iron protein subunit beta [Geomonas]QXE92048.1 nitrogenase molybdenum-iron protein subunit beta [Geomonas subterranea]QXM09859.1 nitrogenase molybdenum-iron protein subunit beta [Geomonas subterranea]
MANNLGLKVKPVTEIPEAEVNRVAAWINTEEYKEKNFARQALVINPAHACQPLGAELAAHGFEGSLPFVHGSQGCASYYRSTLNRHFREPAPAVSDAMTEDGAVFGGQNNLHEGLENSYKLYKPKMISVFTSCMPEIIGDDLTAFIKNARIKGFVPNDLPIPYANTPSFNGSHIHGYDAMLLAILQTLTQGKKVEGRCTGKLNLLPGFDANTGNIREYKRILEAFGIPYTVLADISDVFDSPNDGTYRPYPGGTKLEDAADSVNGKVTLALGTYSTAKTYGWLKDNYSGKHASIPMPFGIAKTDAFLLKLSELTGKPIPASLKEERGHAVDLLTDAHQYIHGKKFAVYGDPDYLLGLVSFLLEVGAKPTHVLCSKGTKKLEKELQALLDSSPFGKEGKVYVNKDLWHLRSLVMTEPVDAIIGDTHGKFAARDAKVPLFRFGFPIFDRVNLHREPLIGYQGVMNMMSTICNKFIDVVDETCDDRQFEMMR